jgi:hypothetical protein
MDSFTTKITDQSIINELPDMSILDSVYSSDANIDTVKKFIDSSVLRKRLQQLLEYKMSDLTILKLNKLLIDKFIEAKKQEDADIEVNRISDVEAEINGDLYSSRLKSFGDSVFVNEHFRELFFTEDVLKEVFEQNDIYFEKALYATESFWDNLLNNTDLWNKIKTDYPDKVSYAYKNVETAYVKIVLKESGIEEYTKFSDINTLISRDVVFSNVLSNDAGRNITLDSPYGMLARALFLTESKTLSDIENNEELIEKMKNDIEIREALCVYGLISDVEGSKLYNTVVNNDVYLGLLISQYFKMNEHLTFTQFIYEEKYRKYFQLTLDTPELLSIIQNSVLLKLVNKDFMEAYYDVSAFKNVVYGSYDGDTLVLSIADKNEKGQILYVNFPNETSNNFAASKIDTLETNDVIVASFYNNSKKRGFITLDRKVEFDSDEAALLFSSLEGKHFVYVGSNGMNVVSIDTDGRVMCNKYYTDKFVDKNSIKSVNVYDNNIAIFTRSEVLVLGETEKDAKLISNVATANIDDIKYMSLCENKVFVTLNSGVIKEVTEEDMIDTTYFDDFVEKDENGEVVSSAKDNIIKKVISLNSNIFVLDEGNNLWIKQSNGKVSVISNVLNIELGNQVVNVETDKEKYIYTEFNGALRDYRYEVNL